MWHLLHSEASSGWGGQEIRIFKEACGMQQRGHSIFFVCQKGSQLAQRARHKGFPVLEIDFSWKYALVNVLKIIAWCRRHSIDCINTHSSKDAWLVGLCGKVLFLPVLRTRHLSTPVLGGLNGIFLYRFLADAVVTTSQKTAEELQTRFGLASCQSIPTGVLPGELSVSQEVADTFRKKHGLEDGDFVAGTVCVLRSWKGVQDMIKAALLLKHLPYIKWLIVGHGDALSWLQDLTAEHNLCNRVIFTGFMEKPALAMAAMNCFLLLSTGHEGVSQATLQASFLKKPLITTSTGGLNEVCIDQKTGFLVPASSPDHIAKAVETLSQNPALCTTFGSNGHTLVQRSFLFEHTLDKMETVLKSKI